MWTVGIYTVVIISSLLTVGMIFLITYKVNESESGFIIIPPTVSLSGNPFSQPTVTLNTTDIPQLFKDWRTELLTAKEIRPNRVIMSNGTPSTTATSYYPDTSSIVSSYSTIYNRSQRSHRSYMKLKQTTSWIYKKLMLGVNRLVRFPVSHINITAGSTTTMSTTTTANKRNNSSTNKRNPANNDNNNGESKKSISRGSRIKRNKRFTMQTVELVDDDDDDDDKGIVHNRIRLRHSSSKIRLKVKHEETNISDSPPSQQKQLQLTLLNKSKEREQQESTNNNNNNIAIDSDDISKSSQIISSSKGYFDTAADNKYNSLQFTSPSSKLILQSLTNKFKSQSNKKEYLESISPNLEKPSDVFNPKENLEKLLGQIEKKDNFGKSVSNFETIEETLEDRSSLNVQSKELLDELICYRTEDVLVVVALTCALNFTFVFVIWAFVRWFSGQQGKVNKKYYCHRCKKYLKVSSNFLEQDNQLLLLSEERIGLSGSSSEDEEDSESGDNFYRKVLKKFNSMEDLRYYYT